MVNPKKFTSKHITVKFLKTKDEENFSKNSQRKWCITYRGLTANFSSEMEAAGCVARQFLSAERKSVSRLSPRSLKLSYRN